MSTLDVDLSEREQARKRVVARRDFVSHLVTYIVINTFLIVVWAVTGSHYFWPVWILAGWGVGLVLHGWDAFLRQPVTEADVDAELRRAAGSGRTGGSTTQTPRPQFH